MMRCRRTQACWLGIILLSLAPSVAAAQTRFIGTRGKELVSPDGKPLLLKGINLGNWLLPEGYMFKFKTANSPRLIQATINELVGEPIKNNAFVVLWILTVDRRIADIFRRNGFRRRWFGSDEQWRAQHHQRQQNERCLFHRGEINEAATNVESALVYGRSSIGTTFLPTGSPTYSLSGR